MAFRILHGERAGDLIDACMEEICTEALLWPHKRAFLIVPEQTKADMERRYLEVRQRLCRDGESGEAISEALMLVDVLSFHRFAHRILSDIGGIRHDLSDPAMQSLLIHRVLNEGKDDFRVLSSVSQRIGFASQIESVLEDFYRYDITPDMLRNVEGESVQPLFNEKMQELALLMERLDRLTGDLEGCQRVRPLNRLCAIIDELNAIGAAGSVPWPYSRLKYLSDASVWITGFGQTRNFTPEESEIIKRLSWLCTKVTVSVCADSDTAGRLRDGAGEDEEAPGREGFHFGGQTIRLLKGSVPSAEFVEVPRSENTAPEIRHLAESFLRRERKPFTGQAGGVTSMLFASATDELSYVAGKVRELVLLHGYRYKDITIVLCDPMNYQSNLHSIFAEFGMDPFLDKRKRLSDTALMRFVAALMDLGVNGWSYNSLMQCVKSGMCHITREDADRLENYCLKHGLFKGYRIFDEARYTKEKDPKGPELFALVQRVLFPLREVVSSLLAEPRCDAKSVILSAFLEIYIGGDSPENSVSQIEFLGREWVDAGDHDAALALVASWNELMRILDRLAGPMGDMRISLINFRDALLFATDAAPAGAIPAFVDQLRITDVTRGFQRDCKVMFLVGAQREHFPNKALSEGFLRGHERELLATSLRVRFPNRSKDGAYADFFTAYAILDCPSEKLYISSLLSKEPSSVFRLISDCLPNATFLDHPPKGLHDPRLFTRTALLRYAASMIHSDDSSVDPRERAKAGALLRQHPEFTFRNRASGDPFDVRLSAGLIDRIFEPETRMSVSQIEKYESCPFQYFASYVLRLLERDRFEVDARETGTVAHKMMELALQELIGELRDVPDEEQRKEVMEEYTHKDFGEWSAALFEKACAADRNIVSQDPALLMGSGRRMIAIVRESLRAVISGIRSGNFTPRETEWSYGKGNSNPPIVIQWPGKGRSVAFNGVIDRVDVDPTLGVFRVLDYKTGEKEVNYRQMYAGLSVQLPGYIYAYGSVHPELRPADAGYFVMKNPVIRVDLSKTASPEETAIVGKNKQLTERGMKLEPDILSLGAEHALIRIRESCEKIFDGRFPIRPVYDPKNDKKIACVYCEYKAICGIDPERPPSAPMRALPQIEVEPGKKPGDRECYIEAVRREVSDRFDIGNAFSGNADPTETDAEGGLST
ncbi:MAG: PD-(D/E)XK nuclease family protein [Clostridiales bacterium]|nr:PD-(D/E)XK nuclease family protein [Clostridiales bacterium]